MPEEDNKLVISKFDEVILRLNDTNLALDKIDTRVIDSTITISDSLQNLSKNLFDLISVLKNPKAIESTKDSSGSSSKPSISNSSSKIDNKLSVSNILGENDKDNLLTAIAFAKLKNKLISKIKSNLPKTFEFDSSLSVSEILGENDRDNLLTAVPFARLKNKLISKIKSNLPKTFEFDSKVSISEILGESNNDNFITAFSFARLKNNLIANIRSNLPKDFDFDTSLSVSEILGQSDRENLLTALPFARLKRKLINNIKGNLPKEFNFDTNISVSEILGQSSNDNNIVAFSYGRLKTSLINKIKKALPKTFNFDTDVSISEILGQPKKDSKSVALNYAILKNQLINKIRRALPKTFNFDTDISVSEILGQATNDNIYTAFQFGKLKTSLINKIKNNLPDEFIWNTNVSIGDIFGEMPKAGMFFKIRLAKIKNDILSLVQKLIKGQKGVSGKEEGFKNPFTSIKESISSPFKSIKSKVTDKVNSFKELFSGSRKTSSTQIQESPTLNDLNDKDIFENKDDVLDSSNLLNEVKLIKEATISMKGSLEELVEAAKGNSLQAEEDRLDLVESNMLSSVTGKSPIKEDKGISSSAPDGKGKLDKIGSGIGSLGKGLGTLFSSIFEGIGKGLKAISNPRYLIGVAVIGALGGALFIAGKAFKQFGGDINWKNVLYGVGILGVLAAGLSLIGKMSAKILIGSLALIAISGAIFIAAKAFQQFSGIDWKGVLIGVGALGIVAAAAFGLSLAAPAFLIGAAVLAALGVALIPVAYAFKIFSDAVGPLAEAFKVISGAIGDFVVKVGDTIVKILNSIASTIERLGNIDAGNLFQVALGITAIGAALVAFGGGGALGAVLGFFAADPVKKFERFAEIANPLSIAAKAIQDLDTSIRSFTNASLDKPAEMLDKFAEALASLYSVTAEQGGVLGGIKAKFTGGGDKLKGLKDLVELSNQLNTALTFELGDPATVKIEPSSKAMGENASAIHNGSMERESLMRNQQASAISTPIIMNSSGAPVTQNMNNVTYNRSNHIDSTMVQSIMANAF